MADLWNRSSATRGEDRKVPEAVLICQGESSLGKDAEAVHTPFLLGW